LSQTSQFFAIGAASSQFAQPGNKLQALMETSQINKTMNTKWNDDAFARMVAEEVKNKTSLQEREELQNPEHWDRWKRALIALSDNLQRQIDSIEADSESDQQRYSSLGAKGGKLTTEALRYYGEKATRIKRFKYHVDRRLDDVCLMIDTGETSNNDGWKEVDFYRRAIIAHKNLLEEFDLEDTAIDRSLWDCLDGKWTFGDINNDNL
jgi:hypothetical protein